MLPVWQGNTGGSSALCSRWHTQPLQASLSIVYWGSRCYSIVCCQVFPSPAMQTPLWVAQCSKKKLISAVASLGLLKHKCCFNCMYRISGETKASELEVKMPDVQLPRGLQGNCDHTAEALCSTSILRTWQIYGAQFWIHYISPKQHV